MRHSAALFSACLAIIVHLLLLPLVTHDTILYCHGHLWLKLAKVSGRLVDVVRRPHPHHVNKCHVARLATIHGNYTWY